MTGKVKYGGNFTAKARRTRRRKREEGRGWHGFMDGRKGGGKGENEYG
jgi:hypothetical protein